ncbi:MAG: DUF1152 domain-containing protein [Actinobacteria bacterium]|nr:DUF1152 domain-containing protein [Actinomycetota bacterium]
MSEVRPVPVIEEVARRARSAVVMGNGGGSDCLVATLVSGWLRTLGVERVLGGGIACQWWADPGWPEGRFVEVLAPDLYDPRRLEGARPVHDHAVIIGPEASLDGRAPHEATLAAHSGGEAFVLSLHGGGRGIAAGLSAVVAYAEADLVVSVDVGSDTLSTGREVRPVQTALADLLALSALLAQDVPAYFGLAGYGVDAEMAEEDLDGNFAAIVAAGGLRGAVIPGPEALDQLEALHHRAADPVGSLVARAGRGEFGLHRIRKDTPWGAVARLGPAAIPIWLMDPHVVADAVARHALDIGETSSLREATEVAERLGRIPETLLVRMVDYGRKPGREP